MATKTKVRHPAKFSGSILEVIAGLVPPERYPRVLDPFAGTGKIHQLPNATTGVEIEPEWAAMHSRTLVGDATRLPSRWKNPPRFDAIVTSPCYGNRFADHHEARDGSRRRSYRHDLGRMPSPGSAGVMAYGDEYRDLHLRAWRQVAAVLRPGGRFVLNVSDFVKKRAVVPVATWHLGAVSGVLGVPPVEDWWIPTTRFRYGENADARVDGESVIVWEKPR